MRRGARSPVGVPNPPRPSLDPLFVSDSIGLLDPDYRGEPMSLATERGLFPNVSSFLKPAPIVLAGPNQVPNTRPSAMGLVLEREAGRRTSA
jgi:hypothetical protein